MSMFKKALFLMLVAEGLSLLAFWQPRLPVFLLTGIFLLTFAVTAKNPVGGTYILFGELFLGSRGHLLDYRLVSVRELIFIAVVLGWLLNRLKERAWQAELKKLTVLPGIYWLWLLVITAGSVWGVVSGNGLRYVFMDANGYWFFLIAPLLLAVVTTREHLRQILEILAAAIMIIAVKTLALFLWFAYAWPGVALLYHWVVLTNAGEITGYVGSISRVFLASQFYALVGIFIFGLLERKRWLVVAAALLAVLLSLSRSFWLGGLGAAAFCMAALWLRHRWKFWRALRWSAVLLAIVVLELGGIYLATAGNKNSKSAVVESRIVNPANEAAGSARLLELPALLDAIKTAPLLGSGFGKQVAYNSMLPDRVSAQNPGGRIQSYAFEWSYLDIVLKIGLLGLIVYLLFIAKVFQQGWRTSAPAAVASYLNLGLLSGLAALLVLNFTTPYLNRPLGIGYLLLCFVAFQLKDSAPSPLRQEPGGDV